MSEKDYEKWKKQREKGAFYYVLMPTIAVMAGILLLRLVWFLAARDAVYFTNKFMVQIVAVIIILIAGWSFDWYRNEYDFHNYSKNSEQG